MSETHNPPRRKVQDIWTFRLLEVCKRHTNGIGKAKMMKSVMTFMEPRMMSCNFRSTHLGCTLGTQSARMGRHCNKFAMVAVKLYAATKAPTHQRVITKLRMGKLRLYKSRIENLVVAMAGLYSIVAARTAYWSTMIRRKS